MRILIFTALIVSLIGCRVQDPNQCNEVTFEPDQDQLASDLTIIDQYLNTNNINAQIDESGLRYVVNNPGAGSAIEPCEFIDVQYTGRLMSTGEVFDSTGTRPVRFNLSEVIPGWQIGLPLVNRGNGEITLYIPSVYGYRDQGAGDIIPPNANLIFDIKIN